MGPGDSLGEFYTQLMDQEESQSGLLGRAFDNAKKFVTTWDDKSPVTDNLADKLRDTGLEAIQGAVHTVGAINNPLNFVLDLIKDIPFLSDFGSDLTEAIEWVFAALLNPIQLLMLGQKAFRITMSMYTKYDRKRLQNLRQHTLTYASFVQHLSSNPEIVELCKRNLYDEDETTHQPVVRVLGAKLSAALMEWSTSNAKIRRVGFTSITNTYYRNSNVKCATHNRLRCVECHKVTLGIETATGNISRAVRRACEWGDVVEDVETEVRRLREEVRVLQLRECP